MIGAQASLLSQHLPPLAQRVRPDHLSDFIGQNDLVGKNSLLVRSVHSGNPFSMIFWGPPGSGKTTLTKIIAKEFEIAYHEISAVSSGVADIRKIIAAGEASLEKGRRTILFIDEIHRFSKSQQDALLHAVETGLLILFGATTENPSFEVISPLLSRCKILKLNAYSEIELHHILERAIQEDIILSQKLIKFENDVENLLVKSCGGDARKMLNTLELSVSVHPKTSETILLTITNINEALQRKNIIYDKTGDYHYDTISAFIKSVRGSDPDAAVYWLAVMLEGGEKPEFIARRLLVLASEDVGNADPYALMLANSCMQAVHTIGMPESSIILGQVTTYLAGAPKSNAAYKSIKAAQEYVKQNGAGSVPLHLRNAPTKLMKSFDYGKGYDYPHSHPNHFIKAKYFPDEIKKPPSFYKPTNQGREKFLKERLALLWGDDC